MFKKILVPLDGSELAEKILPDVEYMAKSMNAQITLFTASHLPGATGLITEETLKQAQSDERENSERYLKKIAEVLNKMGLEVNWVYKEGLASTQIVATAKEQNADLIAMATHGSGEVAWNLGNVTEKVMKHASLPILLLPVIEKNQPDPKPEWFLGT